jgi:4a-hydroxytetrahydrobiopterin dehydratase
MRESSLAGRGGGAAAPVKIPPDSLMLCNLAARGCRAVGARTSKAGERASGRAKPGGSGVVARLEGNARRQALAGLKGWKEEANRDAISKEFRFADFNRAFAFMTQVALKAERMDHHPEWSNVFNRVSVLLSTHDCGGLSQRDIDLARFIDTLAS